MYLYMLSHMLGRDVEVYLIGEHILDRLVVFTIYYI